MDASFAYKISEARRRREYPLLAVNDKEVCRKVFAAYGVPHPRGHTDVGPLQALTPQHLVAPRVIKPTRGKNSRGVCALVPRRSGQWWDLMSGKEHDFPAVVHHLGEARKRWDLDDWWHAEELLLPPDGALRPVPDFKVYAFLGVVGCILVRSTRPRRYRWFDPDWNPVDVGKYEGLIDPALGPPDDPAGLLRCVRALSERLPMPFMRIDVYETSRGVVFGELTPHPGNHEGFNSEWDRRLGGLYEDAERHLVATRLPWEELHGPSVWPLVQHRDPRNGCQRRHAMNQMSPTCSLTV